MSAKSKRISPRPEERRLREQQVLMGLVREYINTGRPVSSATLQRSGFESLSPATIRNYFAELEGQGYLAQEHSSAGRVPTAAAFRLYAEAIGAELNPPTVLSAELEELCQVELRSVSLLIQEALGWLANQTGCCVIASAPRFDSDFVQRVKLVEIDAKRVLVVLITDFGLVHSELISVPLHIRGASMRRVERAMQSRLWGQSPPEEVGAEELQLARQLYDESMMRHIARHSSFWEEDLFRAGLSQLLHFPELSSQRALSESMSLLENHQRLRHMLREAIARDRVLIWMGEELASHTSEHSALAFLANHYCIGSHPVGAFGVLAPMRIDYRKIIGLLQETCMAISQALTRNLLRFKIVYRQPNSAQRFLTHENQLAIGQMQHLLIAQQDGSAQV